MESGLISGGSFKVVTDLAILDFDLTTKEMKVEAIHSGVTPKEIQENTGFDIPVHDNTIVTKPPTHEELKVLRHLDPDQTYIG